MNPRLNHAIMLLAALLAIALVGCGQAGQGEQQGKLPTTTPTEWNLDEPEAHLLQQRRDHDDRRDSGDNRRIHGGEPMGSDRPHDGG